MNHNFTLIVAALALGSVFGTAATAAPPSVTFPTAPSLITPPEGNSAFLVGSAEGTQGYV